MFKGEEETQLVAIACANAGLAHTPSPSVWPEPPPWYSSHPLAPDKGPPGPRPELQRDQWICFQKVILI